MIEILEGVFYDPNKGWYEQPKELIDLALEIEQTAPVDFQMEVSENNPERQRLLWAKWNHTTEMGNFQMRVDMKWLAPTSYRNFLSKAKHNQVTIIKL